MTGCDNMNFYGRYCAEHQLSQREKNVLIPDGQGHFLTLKEGCVVSGVDCIHRRNTSMGYQSFCSRFDRILYGCEK